MKTRKIVHFETDSPSSMDVVVDIGKEMAAKLVYRLYKYVGCEFRLGSISGRLIEATSSGKLTLRIYK